MSHHILHLLSHSLRVRVRLDQLHIADTEKGTERSVPMEDIAVIIAASPDLTVTAGALRRMAERNVLLLICNEKFEPCCLNLPYYRATDTELLRRQLEWTTDWKTALWRQVITAKIRNQAANLAHLKKAHALLTAIAERCATGKVGVPPGDNPTPPKEASFPDEMAATPGCDDAASDAVVHNPLPPSLNRITASRRAFFLSDTPAACESRAARHYWKHLLPRLSTNETRREPGTRAGVNGMLDYGYAILRTAVLRSLAAHGFIAAIGLHHTPKAGSFALADDLMEPLRPWCDRALLAFLNRGGTEMREWIAEAAGVLTTEVRIKHAKVRLLHATDLYIQSFADAALRRTTRALTIPMLS